MSSLKSQYQQPISEKAVGGAGQKRGLLNALESNEVSWQTSALCNNLLTSSLFISLVPAQPVSAES